MQIVGYYNQRWSGVHLGVHALMIGTLQNQPPEGYSDAEPAHNLGALVLKFKFRNGAIEKMVWSKEKYHFMIKGLMVKAKCL